jgi:hypothetical protein
VYQLLLFAHITGAVVLACAVMVEIVAVFRLTKARDVGDVAAALYSIPLAGVLAPASAFFLLAFGLAMAGHGGDHTASEPKEFSWGAGWLITAYVLFGMLMASGGGINGGRLKALKHTAEGAQPGPITAEIERMRRDPLLAFFVMFQPCEIVVFLFLMTNKPNGVGSAIAAVVGALLAFALSRVWLGQLSRTEPVAAT